MSQVVNGVTSSSKRPYRKATLFLRQNVSRKLLPEKATHKEVRVFVRDKLKNQLQIMCENEGITQAAMIERLIERESAKLGIDVTTSHS
ncbi:RepB family protein [Klebsiella pneumoniae]